jgi:cell division protein FtsI/penicillin-binding protein 2/cell division protein FtsW (lipid II flippase)
LLLTRFTGGQEAGHFLSINLFGLINLQIVEFIKILLVFFAAYHFHTLERQGKFPDKNLRFSLVPPRYLLTYFLVIVGVAVSTILTTSDIGITLVLTGFLLLMAVIATGEMILALGCALVLGGMGALILTFQYPVTAYNRIAGLKDIFSLNEALARVRWGLVEGGWFGQGLGHGKAHLIPNIDTDFIFIGFAEELGFVGISSILICMGAILWRGYLIALREEDPFRQHLASGITAMISLQTVVVVCGNLGMLPMTGLPLLFLSRGGMTLVTNSILLGILIQIGNRYTSYPHALPFGNHLWPQVKWRLNFMAAVTMLVLLFLMGFAFYTMIGPGKADRNRHFSDLRKIQILETMIDNGVFTASNDLVSYDESRVGAACADLGRAKRQRVSLTHKTLDRAPLARYARLLEVRDGKVVVPRNAFNITNPRRAPLSDLDIIDRQDRPLARTREGRRQYPQGAALYPVVGLRSHGTTRFLEDHGPRYAFEHLPRPGTSSINLKMVGQRVKSMLQGQVPEDPRNGTITLKTTVDAQVQKLTYDYFQDKGYQGAAVAMAIPSGELIAFVSSPSMDPNRSYTVRELNSLFLDEKKLLNHHRAMHMLYPPGSVFKIFTGAALLEYREEEAALPVDCHGHDEALNIRDHDYPPTVHGEIMLDRALQESCNVYFANKAVILGSDLQQLARKLHFEDPITPIPGLPEFRSLPAHVLTTYSTSGTLRQAENAKLSPDRVEYLPSSRLLGNDRAVGLGGIGQTVILATPLHVAMLTSAVANGGKMVYPRLIDGLYSRDKSGQLNLIHEQESDTERVFSRSTARALTAAMEKVYQEGTASSMGWRLGHGDSRPFIILNRPPKKPVRVAAKTGTAQVAGQVSHSWFTCFAPADDPQVVVTVVVENKGYGSQHAGPAAMFLLRDALKSLAREESE